MRCTIAEIEKHKSLFVEKIWYCVWGKGFTKYNIHIMSGLSGSNFLISDRFIGKENSG